MFCIIIQRQKKHFDISNVFSYKMKKHQISTLIVFEKLFREIYVCSMERMKYI